MPKQVNKKKATNVTKIHHPFNISIGVIICIIVFIYVAFQLFGFLTDDTVSVYEVASGSIENDYEFHALAIRSEEVEYSPRKGYAYYFASEMQRVGAKSLVYCVDETGDIHKIFTQFTLTDEQSNQEALANASEDVSLFVNNYSSADFYKVYALRSNLNSALYRVKQDSLLDQYSGEIAQASSNNTLSMVYAKTPGVVSYNIDGLEGLTLDTFTEADVTNSENTDNSTTADDIDEGAPVYKTITSDNWNLVMEASDQLLADLDGRETVNVEFLDDNISTTVTYSVIERNGINYLVLNLDDGVERYGSKRYCNIRLIISESKGLKIPVSAITSKTFFTIPKVYFMSGDNSSNLGLMIKGDKENKYVTPTIYHESDTCFYVDDTDLSASDQIIIPNSNETYTVGAATDTLSGVYNVNKGYAVFKQIDLITENNDFAIVKTGTDYGIALYDYIALYGDSLEEFDLI